MRYVFILGSHRTGSKLLGDFFGQYFQNVRSIHQYGRLRIVNVISNIHLSGLIPQFVFNWLLNLLWVSKWPDESSGLELYVESNGFNYLAADHARSIRSKVKVIHVVRDPKQFVISTINWTDGRWQSRLANQYIPFWGISGFLTGSMGFMEWHRMNRAERLLWAWQYKNSLIEHLYSKTANGYLRIRMEDLIDRKTREEALRKICELCGLSFSTSILQYFDTKRNASEAKSFSVQDFDRCVSSERYTELCGNLKQRYGYHS